MQGCKGVEGVGGGCAVVKIMWVDLTGTEQEGVALGTLELGCTCGYMFLL